MKRLPKNLVLLAIEIPEGLKIENAPWMPEAATSRQIGEEWLESKAAPVLRVPSVIFSRQLNYLLNPDHPLFDTIQVVETQPFAFDSRLLSSIPAPTTQ